MRVSNIIMSHYKLTYFAVRGLAEPSRQLFALAGVKYDDIRIQSGSEEWQKLKPKTPFGHLPVLHANNFEIAESGAIARYLAKQFGYAGKTPEEEAVVDSIVDQVRDFFASFRKLLIAKRTNQSKEEIAKIEKEVVIPVRDTYLKGVNKFLEHSKSGFLVGNDVTFADLFVVDNLITLEKNGLLNFADEPKLEALYKHITAIPAIKKWNEERPDTTV